MKIRSLLASMFAASLLFMTACKDDQEVIVDNGAYEGGVLVSVEGGYNKNQAEVSYISSDLSQVAQNIYALNNDNQVLGDVLQTIAVKDDKAFLVVNNSNKVEVVNRYSFKKMTTISTNINNPRYVAFSKDYIYITNDAYLGEKYVAVYKLSDFSFVKKINIEDVAERVVVAGDKVYVQNASFGYGNKISIIKTSDNAFQTTISVPNGDIKKTIGYGDNVYSITSDGVDSYIYRINAGATSIAKEIKLKGIADASNLEIANDVAYFSSANKVYSLPLNDVIPQYLFSASQSNDGTLYGFNVIDGKIFTANAKDFNSPSEITVYSIIGSEIRKINGGIGVNGFYKN
ncbi:YncE family protein [Soonwooa purpurea]